MTEQLRLKEARVARVYVARLPLENRTRANAKLTFIVQLRSVFAEAFQPHPLAQEVKELLEGRPGRLIVVHVLLRALARSAVQDADLVLEAQLQCGDTQLPGEAGRTSFLRQN